MAEIGPIKREIIVEPIPETAPQVEPAPEREPAKEPAPTKVPVPA